MMAEKSKALSPAGQDSRSSESTERAGDLLRAAREKRGLSIEETAKKLKTHIRYIEAIESSNYDQLPGDAYTRVYLRSLCALLALNPEEILERFFKERGVTGVDTLRKDSRTKINLALKEKPKPNVTLIVTGCLIALLVAFSFIANRQGWLSSSHHATAAPAVDTTRHKPRPPDTLTKGIPKERGMAAPEAGAALPAASPSARENPGVTQPAIPKNAANARKEAEDTLNRKAAEVQPQIDSLSKVKSTGNNLSSAVKKDSVKPVPLPAPAAHAAGHLQAGAKPLKDTLTKSKMPEMKPAVSLPKDTAKTAAASPWQPKDTLWQPLTAADSVKKTVPAAPAVPMFPGKTMKLRLSVTGDSSWARVFSDGKQWRKTLRRGRGMTFSARDSFNLHIGVIEAVSLIVNGKPVSVPGTGVLSIKIDHNGVTRWTLDKWNSVFEGRY